MLICWACIFAANISLLEAQSRQESSLEYTILSYGVSILIVFFNQVANYVINKTSNYGHYDTHSGEEFSMIWKTVAAQFSNTSVILFALKVAQHNYEDDKSQIWGRHGLINQVYLVIQNAAIAQVTYKSLDIPYFTKRLEIRKTTKEIKENTCVLTQEEAHEIFEYPMFDMVENYVDITKYMLSACFYHSILPLGTCWTIFILFVAYWQDKYRLLRRRSYAHEQGPELAYAMVEILEWTIIAYAGATIIFERLLTDSIVNTGWLCLTYAICNAFFPMKEFN